jgi:hypothetical protein
MRRLLIAALALLVLAGPAAAQFDGGPGSRPRTAAARQARPFAARPPATILQRTTNQSVANSTGTFVSWDTTPVQDDVGAFSASNPLLVTVPGGFTKMRVTYYINWTANSTGIRNSAVNILGGANLFGVAGPASNETAVSFTSRWWPVSAGQQYELNVFHTAGGAINLNGGSGVFGNSWIEFDWAP